LNCKYVIGCNDDDDDDNNNNKCKVVPVLLTEHHAMKAHWGSGSITPRIL